MLVLKSLDVQSRPAQLAKVEGSVVAVQGPLVIARVPLAAISDICWIVKRNGQKMAAQVVSFKDELVSLAPFEDTSGVMPGSKVISGETSFKIPSSALIPGMIVDALGRSIAFEERSSSLASVVELDAIPPHPLKRRAIETVLKTGVTAIDALCSIGYGQRMGLFAGPGVGKSTLLGMIARAADVDLTVIALVGERGREVKEFIDHSLGEQGLKRAIIVVATSDESGMRRSLAAKTATAIAEYHRDRGKRVLLLVDSLTRVARAVRDVSLAAGELPVRQGFTPSVYEMLPRLVERAGNSEHGSITAIYTVLTQANEEQDALGEEVKSLLDGHLVLSPRIAEQGIRPAIDVLRSISRLASSLNTSEEEKICSRFRALLARLQSDKDLVMLGGSPDAELAAVMQFEDQLKSALTQGIYQQRSVEQSRAATKEIVDLVQFQISKVAQK